MVKRRVEKLDGAFPDFVNEADLSLDQILDTISASNLPLPEPEQNSQDEKINRFEDFYQNKISETCDDILMLEKNAATIVQADIENLYKGSFVREFAARYHMDENDAREKLRLDLAGQLQSWGMKCINKRHYALPREIKHIIRMDFYGTVDKIDEKKDGRSSKKLSDTYRRRSPEKTAGTKPADYNLGSSPVWIVFRQFRSFRLLERNLPELLIKEGVSPQDYKRLNAYDLSQVLYNHYITKSKPDAERKERANLFLGAKYRFVKAFIRRNKTALRRIMDMRGYDHRYTETLIKHMEQYGVTGGFDVIEKNYTQEMLEELKKRKLLSPEIKVGDPITDDQIARIKAAGFIGTILARDESGNPITGPELNVHHKVAVQDCGEKTNFAEVNQFKNLCLIIEPYHFFAHSLDRTGMANGAEYYVSRIEIGEDVAFYGGFNKLFQIEYDFGQSRTGLYNRNALDAFRNSKRLLDTGDEYWQPDKMPRRQKKAAKKLKQKQALAEKNTQNTNNAVPPIPINRPPEKDEEIIEKPVRTKEKAAQRRDKISRKKDEYMRLRKNLIEKRKKKKTLRAAKKSAIKTISRFEDERKLEKLIQYTMKSQGRKR